jgi:DNA-binding transcriptional LysR family regulator
MRAFEDLTLLRAFVSIVECGSISAAARQLRVSQPGLSRQLRTFEELCGTALIRRDTHRMSVTETGQQVLADAKAMLAQAEVADRRLREECTTLSGHLRLFATTDTGQWVVTPILSQFLKENPKDSYQSVKRFVRKLPSRSGSGVWNANREKNSSWAWERRSMTAKVGNAAVGSCGWY